MPAQTGKSSLFGKFSNKFKQAHEKHKGDETVISAGFDDLPSGINGVAQLVLAEVTEVKDGKKNAGARMVQMQGVIVSPRYFKDELGNTVDLQGRRTKYFELMCDTPESTGKRKTFEDHLANLYNELRKLGCDTNEINSEDDIAAMLEGLVAAGPYFKFRTWKGQKATTGPYKDQEPRVNETWEGVTEYDGGDPTDEVQDQSAAPPPARTSPPKPGSNGAPKAGKTPPTHENKSSPAPRPGTTAAPQQTGRKLGPAAKKPEPEPEPEAQDEDATDVTALGESADNGDADAQAQLTEMATAAGITEEQITAAENWAQIAELIGGGSADEPTGEDQNEPADEAETTDWEPQKGEIYGYRPMGPGGKKGTKKIEVEIVKVDKRTRTADLRNNTDKKTVYGKQSWDLLESA